MKENMQNQEKELLEGYRQLKQESRRFIMSTVVTAVAAESAVKRQEGLAVGDCRERAEAQFFGREGN